MGWLAVGTPLPWSEARQNASHVREWGIEQLLAIWRRAKGKERDALLWGDEVEYLVVAYDDDHRQVNLSLRQADILKALAEDEALAENETLAGPDDSVPVLSQSQSPFMRGHQGNGMPDAEPVASIARGTHHHDAYTRSPTR